VKDLLTYYLCIFLPIALLIISIKTNLISDSWFTILFLFYLLYRQFTDAWRLQALGEIDKVTLKILSNPLLQLKYFNKLYFGKSK
jgi:hypothetical protein